MKCDIFKQVSQLVSLRQSLQEAGFVNISFTNVKREYQPENVFFKCQSATENNISIDLKVCEYLGTSITIYNELYKLTQKAVEVGSIEEIIKVIKMLLEQFNVDCNVLAPL